MTILRAKPLLSLAVLASLTLSTACGPNPSNTLSAAPGTTAQAPSQEQVEAELIATLTQMNEMTPISTAPVMFDLAEYDRLYEKAATDLNVLNTNYPRSPVSTPVFLTLEGHTAAHGWLQCYNQTEDEWDLDCRNKAIFRVYVFAPDIETEIKADTQGFAEPIAQVPPDRLLWKVWAQTSLLFYDIPGVEVPNVLGIEPLTPNP